MTLKFTGLKDSHKSAIALAVIFVISLLGVRELLLPGYFESHDGIIHVMRFSHFDEALRSGQIPVRWLSTWMAGYGSPVFNFNWNLPYYIGSLFHAFGATYEESIKLVLVIGFALSGLFSFLYLIRLTGNRAASVLGAVVYMWAPYHFTDIYVRGAVGEATAFLFLPLIFLSVHNAYKSHGEKSSYWYSFIWAFFILSHNITSIICGAFFLIYLIFLKYFLHLKWQVFKNVIASFLLGIGLASFLWLPAFFETKYTNYYELYGKVQTQFVSFSSLINSKWQYAYAVPEAQSVSMSFQLGMILLGLQVIAIGVLIKFFNRIRKKDLIVGILIFFTFMTIVSVFFSVGLSRMLYEIIPLATTIGFPWRFLTFATFSLSVVAAITISYFGRYSKYIGAVIVFVILVLYWPYSKIVSWRYSNTDEGYRQMVKTNINYLPDMEFLPKENSYVALLEEKGSAVVKPFFQSKNQNISIVEVENSPLKYRATISTETDSEVSANAFNFPGWTLKIDDQNQPLKPDKYGLISFNLPKGDHEIDLLFQNTPVRIMGNAISLLTFFGILGLLLRKKFHVS